MFRPRSVNVSEASRKMNTTALQDAQEKAFQALLEQYLASREALKSSVGETSVHLDEDLLSAFAEGSLSERESVPVVSHLVDCGFCRHKTAELVMLDLELSGGDEISVPASAGQTSGLSQVVNDVLAKIFGSGEQTVFAHSDEDEKEKQEKSATKN